MDTKSKIATLRKLMKENKIDVYYIPNEDDHLSEEFTADYYKSKSFISGFKGESGCVVVTQKFAGLWTDGRYFIQANKELKGSGIKLMKMAQAGVPTAMEYIIDNIPKGGVVGYDGRVVSATTTIYLEKVLKEKKAKLKTNLDLVNEIWVSDRPAMPLEELFILDKKYTGESIAERVKRVRKEMEKKKADVLILTALEDPCWLLNIRGLDVACTPLSYAFSLITKNQVIYYVDKRKVNKEVNKYFKDNKVIVKEYDELEKDIKKYHKKKIWISLNTLNTNLYNAIAKDNKIINQASPIALFRAMKNDIEIKNIKNAHIKDGVTMVKFIKWIKENIGVIDMDEVSVQNHLYELREKNENYIHPSFPTICAYGGNAAMMHYSATEKSHAKINKKGFLLVDSGGTYKDGTTDITRTIALGKLTNEEKKLYTLVLKGHLALARAKFLEGTSGNNLDILARGPLWNINIDYQCGTGHGVGHVLGVHEGPHSIRWGLPTISRPAVSLRKGMVVTNEPGVYMSDKLGIRIENELVVVEDEKNEYGQFLKFEDITYCPYELDAIDVKYLDDIDIQDINAYHKKVYKTISPYLCEKGKAWLKKATREIKR